MDKQIHDLSTVAAQAYNELEHDIKRMNNKCAAGVRVISVNWIHCMSIDLDTQDEGLVTQAQIKLHKICREIITLRSTGGNWHLYGSLKTPFASVNEYREMAVSIGSDPVREMASMMQHERGHPWPWIMFETQPNTDKLMAWEDNWQNFKTVRDRTKQVLYRASLNAPLP